MTDETERQVQFNIGLYFLGRNEDIADILKQTKKNGYNMKRKIKLLH